MTSPTEAPSLADPLNWPAPKAKSDGIWKSICPLCGEVCLYGASYTDDRRAYIRHYYREHAYRNWSA